MTNLSNIVEILAKQALGANQQSNQSQGGLGGILGSVLGQLGGNNQQSAQGGLGGILGSVLGQLGGQQQRSADRCFRYTKFIDCSFAFGVGMDSKTGWLARCFG